MVKKGVFCRNLTIFTVCLLCILSSANANSILKSNDKFLNSFSNSPSTSDVFDNDIIYTGIQNPLLINETAIYSEITHYTVGNGTYSEYISQNAEFPIDETHGWQGYRYSANMTNLVDERDWVLNGDFGSDTGLTPTSHIVQNFGYIYGINEKKTDILVTFDGGSCDYMRLHFINMTVQGWYDNIFIWDQSNNEIDNYSGNYVDLVSPWYYASKLKISIDSNMNIHGHFYIDYFETYSGAMFVSNMNNWTSYGHASDLSRMSGSAGRQLNNSAIKISMNGYDHGVYGEFTYYFEDESGINQELDIPRGKVVDAWISMDFLLRKGVKTDDMYLFFKIDDEIIYTQGFRTITQHGLAQWQTTGFINMNYWQNDSTIFNDFLTNLSLNISAGIQSGSTAIYKNVDHMDLQVLYIDNVQLILKTEANSTQMDVNLEFDQISLSDSENKWGSGTYERYHTWSTNPMQILLTTDAPKIEFDLHSKIYGFNYGTSKIQQYGNQGSRVSIYTNGSVQWDLYHNVFIPMYYSAFQFKGIKPLDWELISIRDPLGDSVLYSHGQKEEQFFTVEYPHSAIPGWWSIKARSTNMVQSTSTELWNGSDWKNYLTHVSYNISDTLKIRTALNTSLGTIENIASTWANLTIYDPKDFVWFSESVHPTITGQIQFSDLVVGPLNTTGGVYHYSITWTNGTSAGGLNGAFYVHRNIAYTILYPRDAVEDLQTEEILGDVTPLRIILNDSITGAKLSNLHIEYNWTTGTEILIEISQGIYDGSLDTLDLTSPGFYEITFTAWGTGYYNLTFTLKINVVEETELNIIGLDNNIDYGTNFTIRLSYSSKHLGYGIADADITLNMSSSFYYISPETTPGRYLINISSKDAFTGAGNYDILINASKIHFQWQDIVTRIQVLPRSVYFRIFINSADCTFNKSYLSVIKQKLNFSIGIYSSAEDMPVMGGNVYITTDQYTSEPFAIAGNYYFSQVNTSHFGLGVHFISIIFNETTYQSASQIIMLGISKLHYSASLYDTEQTLIINRKNNFEVFIYVEDPSTHLPITDANVSYNWIFGKGFLINSGNGKYKFEESAPNKLGAYDIIFTISSSNADYESASVSLTLVSQIPEGSIKIWWILVPLGAVAATVSTILVITTYKHKVVIPKREHKLDVLRKKTQIFDDITNIKSILLIETTTGRLMFRHIIGGLDKDNEDIFSGFLHAILTLSNRFALKNGDLGDKREYAEFTHEIFHVLVAGGQKVIVALILEEESSEELQKRAFKFLDEFESIYASTLENWNGDRNVFRDTTPKLFEEIFHLSLLKRFTLTGAENIYLIEKSLITTGTISERVSQIVKTVSEERHDFLLKTLISLVPEEDRLQAKDIILRFIKNKYFVPID